MTEPNLDSDAVAAFSLLPQEKLMIGGAAELFWAEKITEQPIQLNWEADGERWFWEIWSSLKEQHHCTGVVHLSDRTPQNLLGSVDFWDLLSPDNPVDGWCLLTYRRTHNQIDVWIASHRGYKYDSATFQSVAQIIRSAAKKLHKPLRNFSWWAAIGPAPGSASRGKYQVLASPSAVGPLRLYPTEPMFEEPIAGDEILHKGYFRSWLIQVESEANGFNWEHTKQTALRDLYRLCALASIAWSRLWTLRITPKHPNPNPTDSPNERYISPVPEAQFKVKSTDELQTPAWFDSAWKLLNEYPGLDSALHSYYEGLSLRKKHPSFALIAFVGCIEALGQIIPNTGKVERCEACGVIKGSTQRFNNTLGLVLEGTELEEAKKTTYVLKKGTYGLRSSTVHTGKMHGLEQFFGKTYSGYTGQLDGFTYFHYIHLSRIQKAAEKLLLLIFAEGLKLD